MSASPTMARARELAQVLEAARTENGRSLVEFVSQGPVLLVFLRHAGCTFCREALADIARDRTSIESGGTQIVLVHQGDRQAMERVVARYGVADLERICDGGHELYQAFGLKRGGLRQVAGWKVWWRGMWAGVVGGHGLSLPEADARQMPGVFWIDRGMVVRRFRHQSAADRPCYVGLAHRDGGTA